MKNWVSGWFTSDCTYTANVQDSDQVLSFMEFVVHIMYTVVLL